jgi:hypothetical protein
MRLMMRFATLLFLVSTPGLAGNWWVRRTMRSPFAALLPLFAALCAAQSAPAPPTIGAVENNFS